VGDVRGVVLYSMSITMALEMVSIMLGQEAQEFDNWHKVALLKWAM
jgi:CheY-specific phosphatase CheX